MMKAATYMMIMIMLIGVGSLFVLKRPDGKTWLSVDNVINKIEAGTGDVLSQSKRTIEKSVAEARALVDEQGSVKAQPVIYKWRDAQGNWIYSDKPNANGDSQQHTLDPSKVTMMAAEDTAILQTLATNKGVGESGQGIPSALNPSAVKKLMEDAKNVQKLMDDRAKTIDEAVGGGS
ncbi:DUF4124 domain-containing protein [Pseudoalteromonas aurantia]|nr:DUF4124 domain-containing protein [Pseudoalteromonas aurantia]